MFCFHKWSDWYILFYHYKPKGRSYNIEEKICSKCMKKKYRKVYHKKKNTENSTFINESVQKGVISNISDTPPSPPSSFSTSDGNIVFTDIPKDFARIINEDFWDII